MAKPVEIIMYNALYICTHTGGYFCSISIHFFICLRKQYTFVFNAQVL